MINHPQKGIFTPTRTQPLTGRNANIQPTMFKRKQIFERTASERLQTPFSGYSFTGSSVTDNSYLARSQVSQFGQQNVIRLIKEQLQKNGISSMSETSEESLRNKNELNILRIQIRSIKESYHQLNKSFKKKIEEQNQTITEIKKEIVTQAKDNTLSRDDMSSQLVEKIKEVEQDIAIKMRLIFGKMQQDLRKQLTNYANREFVPTSFLDDLDKQLNDLDDRIANMESQYEASKTNGNKESMAASKTDKDSSVILSSGSQLKLKQFQRDLINLKKQLDEKSEKIREIDESMKHEKLQKEVKEIKQQLSELTLGLKERQNDNELLKETLQTQMQSQRKKVFEKLQTQLEALANKMDQELVLKSLSLSSSIEPNMFKKKTETSEIVIENSEAGGQSKKLEDTREESIISEFNTSTISSEQSQPETISKINAPDGITHTQNQVTLSTKESPKRTKKITITYGAPQKTPPIITQSPTKIQEVQNQTNFKMIPSIQNKESLKNLYKVDKEGYLMDCSSTYILSPTNSMIFVSEKQIEAIEKSGLIKIEKWNEENSIVN